MNATWGTRDQPSERDPGRLRAEHAYLLLAVVSVSAALVLYAVDYQLRDWQANIGVYPILLSFFIAGYGGWLTHSSERRMRRAAVGELRRMAAAIERLERQVHDHRHTYLPAPRRTTEGQRYIGAVAAGADDETAADITGIDPPTIAAFRSVERRIRRVDNE